MIKSSIILQSFVIYMCVILVIKNGSVQAKICGETDIRNEPDELERKLRNCTLIVGSLSIVLIEKHRDKIDFNKFQFPELR